MPTTPLARCSVLAVLLLCFSSPTFAQLDTATIVGRSPTTAARCCRASPSRSTQEGTGVGLTTVTNRAGRIHLSRPAGRRATPWPPSCRASARRVQRDVRVNVQTARKVDFALDVGAVARKSWSPAARSCCRRSPPTSAASSMRGRCSDLPLLGRRYSELAFLVARRRRGAGRHHQPRRGHVLQRQRQLRDLEQLHARRRRQQLVLDQPPGAQPAGGAAAGRCAAGVQGPDPHLLGGVRQGGRRGDQRLGQAGHQPVQRLALRVLPRRIAQRQHLGQQPRRPPEGPVQSATSPAARSADRSCSGKTFFFGDYQSSRTERALSQTATVPTARMRAGDLSELTGNMVAEQPVRAGRLRRRRRTRSSAPSCIDPVAAQADRRCIPLPNVPGAGFFNNNFISNGILNNDVDQFDVRVDHTCRPDAITCSAATASRTPIAHEPPLLDDPVASGDFASDILIRGQSAVGGWSRRVRQRTCSTNSACRLQQGAIGRRSIRPSASTPTRSTASSGVPKDPRFYGGLPHMPIARFARHWRPVLPSAVPELAGAAVRQEPDLAARAATR